MNMPPSSQSPMGPARELTCRFHVHIHAGQSPPIPLIQSHSHPEETEFMIDLLACCVPPHHLDYSLFVYEPGLGFICVRQLLVRNDKGTDMTYLPLSTSHGDVYETAGVSDPLLGAALGGLLLLLGVDLSSRHNQQIVFKNFLRAPPARCAMQSLRSTLFHSPQLARLPPSLPDVCAYLW